MFGHFTTLRMKGLTDDLMLDLIKAICYCQMVSLNLHRLSPELDPGLLQHPDGPLCDNS